MHLNAMVVARLFVIVVLALNLATANASSNAGIEIEIGKYRLNVYYSVALDYRCESDKILRDPRSALFTLASVVQANSETFALIGHTVQAELYTRAGAPEDFLVIIEDPQGESVVLRDGPVGPDITKEILAVICNRYTDACKRPASKKVDLYQCNDSSCPGQIRFGSFPSDSVNKSFGLIRPPHDRVNRVGVTRDKIGRHFEMLEP